MICFARDDVDEYDVQEKHREDAPE